MEEPAAPAARPPADASTSAPAAIAAASVGDAASLTRAPLAASSDPTSQADTARAGNAAASTPDADTLAAAHSASTSPPASAPRAGQPLWLWQNVYGWVPATIVSVQGSARGACGAVMRVRTEDAYNGTHFEDGVHARGDDTVSLGPQRPAMPPRSVLLGHPSIFSDAQWRELLRRSSVRWATSAAEAAALPPCGGWCVRATGDRAGLGLFALRELPAGAAVTHYGGDVHIASEYAALRQYEGPDSDDIPRATHAVRARPLPCSPRAASEASLAHRWPYPARRLCWTPGRCPAAFGASSPTPVSRAPPRTRSAWRAWRTQAIATRATAAQIARFCGSRATRECG